MEAKEQILAQVLPRAVLEPLTPEAKAALPQFPRGVGYVVIHKFPFRIGRESRVRSIQGRLERIERHRLTDDGAPSNDLYLIDAGEYLNISREHLQIEVRDGAYVVVDRGSACGSQVSGNNIGGGDQTGVFPLNDGDVISVGTKNSPYQYRFISFDGFKLVKKQ
jgi:pSer/pThr/pTyr-binding forkhead associated (FHA) protein